MTEENTGCGIWFLVIWVVLQHQLVRSYQFTHVPQEKIPQLHCGESLKSRIWGRW